MYVTSKNGEWLTTFAETPPTFSHIQLPVFPPTSEEAAGFTSTDGEHITICMPIFSIWILPSVQDTGGFFAVSYTIFCGKRLRVCL